MSATGPLPRRYVGISVVGSGSFASVVSAEDTLLGRRVAIKILKPALAVDETARKRFAREVEAAASLGEHPNIVTVHDAGEWEGRPFLVMELLEGSVADRIGRDGRLPRALALRWLAQAAEALDFAHARGVVHRDVKPANLLLDARGDLRVADFGIAAVAGALEELTMTGAVVGTPGYIAPEVAGGGVATAASDRYSFARVAQDLLPGEAALARGLSANPHARFESAAACVAALSGDATLVLALPATKVAVPASRTIAVPPKAPALRHRVVRFRRAAAVFALVALGSAAVGGYAAIRAEHALRATPASTVAVRETCAISPFRHDANIVVRGSGASSFCTAQPHIFELAGDTWSYRSGAALFAPDHGAGNLALVCKLHRGPLLIHVYDAGQKKIGHRVCDWYGADGWRAAV